VPQVASSSHKRVSTEEALAVVDEGNLDLSMLTASEHSFWGGRIRWEPGEDVSACGSVYGTIQAEGLDD
jgi:hypothetical protein